MWVIDRITDDIAVCECLESGKTIQIPLPKGAKEGHILRQDGKVYIIDHEKTQQRLTTLTNRMNKLFTKNISDNLK